MSLSYSKTTVTWSLCAALCVVLPQALRVIPNADTVYMAMHIPVILCGLICGGRGGLACAVFGCCVSALISGAPSLPMFPVVLLELALMGYISGMVNRMSAAAGIEKAVVYSVVFSVLIGRTAAGVLAACLFSPGREAMALWVWAYLVAGLPSFIIQLILLPAIVEALKYSCVLKECKSQCKKPDQNTERELENKDVDQGGFASETDEAEPIGVREEAVDETVS